MKCESVRHNLSAYLDGELEPSVRARIEQHLAGCEACRTELAQLKETVGLVASLPRVEAPEAFLEEINDRLAREALLAQPRPRPTRRRRPGFLRTASSLAVAAMVLVVAYVGWNMSQTGPGLKRDDRTSYHRDLFKTGPDKSRDNVITKDDTLSSDGDKKLKARRAIAHDKSDSEAWQTLTRHGDDGDVRIVLAAADLNAARALLDTTVSQLDLERKPIREFGATVPAESGTTASEVSPRGQAELPAPAITGALPPAEKIEKPAPALQDESKTRGQLAQRLARTKTALGKQTQADADRTEQTPTHEQAGVTGAVSSKAENDLKTTKPHQKAEASPAETEAPPVAGKAGERLDAPAVSQSEKSEQPVLVLTVQADQLDALLARIAGTKGLTLKSPSAEVVPIGPEHRLDDLDVDEPAKRDSTLNKKVEFATKESTEAVKYVRVLIYLEQLEAPGEEAVEPVPAP